MLGVHVAVRWLLEAHWYLLQGLLIIETLNAKFSLLSGNDRRKEANVCDGCHRIFFMGSIVWQFHFKKLY
jgi:hypothetical protein